MTGLLSVEDLCVEIGSTEGAVPILTDIAFDLGAGETLGIVGESGSGKSFLALALAGLLPAGASRRGRVLFDGQDLLARSDREMDEVRGRRVAMIFQEPMTALNPAMRIGDQVAEGLRLDGLSRSAAAREAERLLDRVQISGAGRAASYPHELSGGQRQRVAIAIALSRAPDLLIADEPTTALDAVVQAEILDLLAELVAERAMALILISHDLGVVARACARTLVLYAGTRFEEAETATLLARPANPYTRALIASTPRPRTTGAAKARLPTIGGTVPRLNGLPPGCRFAPRCPCHVAACDDGEPTWRHLAPSHGVRCIRAGEP